MKQFFASFGSGVLLFLAWCCIIVFTSQDFTHEGPNSAWFAPIDWWGSVIGQSGFSRVVSPLRSTIFLVVGFTVLFAPFIALFSFISFFGLRPFFKPTAAQSQQGVQRDGSASGSPERYLQR
jgi:hypothetical protein